MAMGIEFVQAGFLLALAGLAIPLILHFTHRSRPQLANLGSIRFLREILERTRNRRRILRWLLLALRVAFVGLLAFLFARPYLPQRMTGGADQFVAVLVDASGSMRLNRDRRSLFDHAREEAETIVSQIPPQARVRTALFADRVIPVEFDELSEQQPTFAVTDYAAALRWAADVARQSSAREKHVHLVTDLQRSGLEWSEAATLPAVVVLLVHDVMGNDSNNVAVSEATAPRLVVRPGQPAVVDATISNFGPFTLSETLVTLTLRHENLPMRVEQRVTVAAGAAEHVQFAVPALEAGLWQGTVSIEAIDDLMADNVAYVAILAAPPHRVLLVDGDVRDAAYLSETYFLNLALRLAPTGETADASPYAPDQATADDPLPDLTPYTAVVLANVSGMSATNARRLGEFVRGGGGLLVFGGDRVTPEGCRTQSEAGLLPGAISISRLAEDLPLRIEEWDATQSLFKPFADPQHGDLRRVAFRGCTPIEPSESAVTLAMLSDGTPALVEQRLGDGGVLWFGSSCDLEWSDWPRGSLFVPLVHQMLGRLTGLNDGGPVRMATVGAGARSTPGVIQDGDIWHVVNIDPRESETQRCLESELRMRFADSSAANVAETVADSAASQAPEAALASAWEFRRNEIWHWLVVALVAIASLEFVVGNRVAA
jgi:hypothetical protein